jgi:hypothetical protein
MSDVIKVGFLYCMWNEMFKFYGEIYKLGRSEDPDRRMLSYCTSYPKPCKVIILSKEIRNGALAEKLLFFKLGAFRLEPNREFFKGDLETIKAAFEWVEDQFAKHSDAEILAMCTPIKNKLQRQTNFTISVLPANYKTTYNKIIDINKDTFIEIIDKLKNGTATKDEYLSCEKYKFSHYIDNEIHIKQKSTLFFEVFLKPTQKHIIYNLLYAKNHAACMLLLKDLNEDAAITYLEKNSDQQMKIIDDLVKIMKLNHCHDVVTVIDKTTIKKEVDAYMDKNYVVICSAFCLTAKPLNLVNNKYVFFLNLLRNIFIKWCGCGVSVNEFDKHTKGAINYILKGHSFYDNIEI